LRNHTKILELAQCPIKVRYGLWGITQIDFNLHGLYPPAAIDSFKLTRNASAHWAWIFFKLPNGKHKARRKTVGHRCREELRWVGALTLTQRLWLIGYQLSKLTEIYYESEAV
jgi:hypothetical protein